MRVLGNAAKRCKEGFFARNSNLDRKRAMCFLFSEWDRSCRLDSFNASWRRISIILPMVPNAEVLYMCESAKNRYTSVALPDLYLLKMIAIEIIYWKMSVLFWYKKEASYAVTRSSAKLY